MIDNSSQALHRLWDSRREGRQFPERKDFPVEELRPWLGAIQLVDVVWNDGDPARYRFRLVGTEITEIDGMDVTGKFADEVFTENLEYITFEYDEVLKTKAPVQACRRLRLSSRNIWVNTDKLVLPLSSDGETIDMLIVFLKQLDRLDEGMVPPHLVR